MIRRAADMQSEVRTSMRGGTGAVTLQHYFLKDEFEANARLCARLLIPPGAGIGPHQHQGEDEVYIIESGSGVLDDGRTQTPVTSGDAVLTGKGATHAIRNDGDIDLEIIAMIMCYGERNRA